LGFYRTGGLVPVRVFVVLLIMTGVFCLFRVLSSLAVSSRPLRKAAVYSAVFAAGLSLGIGAETAGRGQINFGIPEDRVTALTGVLLEDPRIITSGSVMAALSLRECGGAGGLRVKSRGEITVFFPEESAARLREFGRGTTVYTEGRLRRSQNS
jgi:hypothetical protein